MSNAKLTYAIDTLNHIIGCSSCEHLVYEMVCYGGHPIEMGYCEYDLDVDHSKNWSCDSFEIHDPVELPYFDVKGEYIYFRYLCLLYDNGALL